MAHLIVDIGVELTVTRGGRLKWWTPVAKVTKSGRRPRAVGAKVVRTIFLDYVTVQREAINVLGASYLLQAVSMIGVGVR